MAVLAIFQSHSFLLLITSAHLLFVLEFFLTGTGLRKTPPFKAGKDASDSTTSPFILNSPRLRDRLIYQFSSTRQVLTLSPDKH
jgi:hypothetical protein